MHKFSAGPAHCNRLPTWAGGDVLLDLCSATPYRDELGTVAGAAPSSPRLLDLVNGDPDEISAFFENLV